MSDNTTPTADVDVISSDDFDRLFDGVTTKTPTADNIIGSNAPKEKEDARIGDGITGFRRDFQERQKSNYC